MPTVQHAALTGAELHEPKDIAAAGADEIYVADGAAGGAMEAYNNVVGVNLGQLYSYAADNNEVTATRILALPWSGRICAVSYSMLVGSAENAVQRVEVSQNSLAVTVDNNWAGDIALAHALFNPADAEWTGTPTNCDYLNSNTVEVKMTSSGGSAVARAWMIGDIVIYIDIGKKAPYTEVA